MQLNVINNAKKNIALGFVNKLVLMLSPFVTRTAIQYILNSQYLGLNSLFNSIIVVLNLAELGFSAAVISSMYKPAADGDIEKMNALLNYYKRAYRVIGGVIGVVGLLLIPFLPRLISGSYPEDINITLLYLIYLFNTVISYFLFAYYSSIIVVHQRDDVNSVCNMCTKLGLTILQVVALLLTNNFYAYAILVPVFTIINNLWMAWRVRKLFPQYKSGGKLDPQTTKEIRKLVIGTFIHKACSVTRFSIDSICISAILGLTATAIYGNYYAILNGVTQTLLIVGSAVMGGIGNHVASRSVNENFQELKKLDFVFLWLSGWCCICMLLLYQPFMELWMGKDMVLGEDSMILFCILCYALKLGDMRYLYNSAKGLWWHNRWRAIAETILNVLLNIILGSLFGINGILLATLISLISCNYIWSTRILFQQYFGMDKIKDYYLTQMKQTAVLLGGAVICYWLAAQISISNVYILLIVRLAICIVIPNIIMVCAYRRSDEFKYLKGLVKHE